MKICQLIDFVNVGGAGIAANRIANALKEVEEVEISQITASNVDSSNKIILGNSRKFQLLHFCSKYLTTSFLNKIRDVDVCRQLEKILNREKPDIINVHNIHSAGWPFSIIKTCLKYAPVSWTLHDCWSFLGSYYPKFTSAPTKELNHELDAFWGLQYPNLTATTPSKWMKKKAGSSHWSNTNITAIHNPVPQRFFETQSSYVCKQVLGLKKNTPTVLVIAGNLKEERKGGNILQSILESDITDKAQFLLIGFGGCFQNENIKSIGFIHDEITLQIAYNAADILLHPAPIDNLPNTVAESISCGTPVLAFKTGGLPEMVIPEKSGWLVDEIGVTPMLNKLQNIIENISVQNFYESTKEIGFNLFNSKSIGISYLKHFGECVDDS